MIPSVDSNTSAQKGKDLKLTVKLLSFDTDEQLRFVEMFNSYMSSGRYKAKEAISKVKQSYAKIYSVDHIVVDICDEIIESLNVGKSYVPVIKKYFKPNIAIGYELSQSASVNKEQINKVSELVKIERNIVKDALSVLFLPIILALLSIVANASIGKYALPMLEQSSSKASTPSFERSFTIFMGEAVFTWWPLLLTMFLVMVFSYKYVQHNYTGSFRSRLDNVWPFSNYRVIWGIRIMQLVGLLKQAAVRDIDALEMISQYGSPYINHHIQKMIFAAKTGNGKREFGFGFLSDIQLIRLDGFRDLSDEEFTKGLLEAAINATTDVSLQNKRAISMYSYIFILLFFVFAFIGIAAIVKSGVGGD